MKLDEPTKDEMKAYRRMVKSAFKPKKFSETMIRLNGEYHQLKNIKPNCISRKLCEALEQTPPLVGWRREIWISLENTIFKHAHTKPDDNKFHKYGVVTSLWGNLFYGLEQQRKSNPGAPTLNALLKPFSSPDIKEQKEAKKSLNFLAKKLDEAETERHNLPPSEKEQIALGEAAGAKAIFNDEGKFAHGTDATPIYIMLLILGDCIEKMPSRMKMFCFLKTVMGKNMPHDEDAFIKLCKRIKLKGIKGREMDMKKMQGTCTVTPVP